MDKHLQQADGGWTHDNPEGVKNSDHPCDLRLRPIWPVEVKDPRLLHPISFDPRATHRPLSHERNLPPSSRAVSRGSLEYPPDAERKPHIDEIAHLRDVLAREVREPPQAVRQCVRM